MSRPPIASFGIEFLERITRERAVAAQESHRPFIPPVLMSAHELHEAARPKPVEILLLPPADSGVVEDAHVTLEAPATSRKRARKSESA